jgi:hypothetical protein
MIYLKVSQQKKAESYNNMGFFVIETALIVLNFEALSGPDPACAGYPDFKSMRAVSIIG